MKLVHWWGGASYLGDLVEYDDYPYLDMTRPAVGLYAGLPLGYTFQFRAGLQYAHLTGDDNNFSEEHFHERGFSFQTDLFEATVVALWEPFARKRYPRTGGYKRIVLSLYFRWDRWCFVQLENRLWQSRQ